MAGGNYGRNSTLRFLSINRSSVVIESDHLYGQWSMHGLQIIELLVDLLSLGIGTNIF